MNKPAHIITDAINVMLLGAAVVITACTPAPAAADVQYSAVVHAVSQHGSTAGNYKFNEVNPGAAIRADFDSAWSVQGGIYKNSYYKTTAYAVAQYTPLEIGAVKLGGFAGLATGYTRVSQLNIGQLSVVAGALAIVDVGNGMSVGVRAVPKLQPKQAGVVTIEFGYKF